MASKEKSHPMMFLVLGENNHQNDTFWSISQAAVNQRSKNNYFSSWMHVSNTTVFESVIVSKTTDNGF